MPDGKNITKNCGVECAIQNPLLHTSTRTVSTSCRGFFLLFLLLFKPVKTIYRCSFIGGKGPKGGGLYIDSNYWGWGAILFQIIGGDVFQIDN